MHRGVRGESTAGERGAESRDDTAGERGGRAGATQQDGPWGRQGRHSALWECREGAAQQALSQDVCVCVGTVAAWQGVCVSAQQRPHPHTHPQLPSHPLDAPPIVIWTTPHHPPSSSGPLRQVSFQTVLLDFLPTLDSHQELVAGALQRQCAPSAHLCRRLCCTSVCAFPHRACASTDSHIWCHECRNAPTGWEAGDRRAYPPPAQPTSPQPSTVANPAPPQQQHQQHQQVPQLAMLWPPSTASTQPLLPTA